MPVSYTHLGLAIGLAALCILLNALDWGTLKVIGEFQKKGPLLFAGQYLYYAFEVVLVLLIAAFGQQFWEALRKGRSQFPFGGVVLCCTWGAIHTLSRGSQMCIRDSFRTSSAAAFQSGSFSPRKAWNTVPEV